MRALCWHGHGSVSVDTVPDPTIQDPLDIIVKITSTAICGSDLHLFDRLPTDHGVRRHSRAREHGGGGGGRQRRHQSSGRRSGGRPVRDRLRPLLVFARRPSFLVATPRIPMPSWPKRRWATPPAGLFGFSHMLGGFSGRSGRISARAPCRCRDPSAIPAGIPRREGAVPLGISFRPRTWPRRTRKSRTGTPWPSGAEVRSDSSHCNALG